MEVVQWSSDVSSCSNGSDQLVRFVLDLASAEDCFKDGFDGRGLLSDDDDVLKRVEGGDERRDLDFDRGHSVALDLNEEDSVDVLGLHRCLIVDGESSNDGVALHGSGVTREDEVERGWARSASRLL